MLGLQVSNMPMQISIFFAVSAQFVLHVAHGLAEDLAHWHDDGRESKMFLGGFYIVESFAAVEALPRSAANPALEPIGISLCRWLRRGLFKSFGFSLHIFLS